MGTYTPKLRTLLDEYKPNDQTRDEYIGLDDYPIWDEIYREALNDKIVNHYFTREIGQESIPMWQFAMRRKMFEIMPFYNELYESKQLEFDPFKTVVMGSLSSSKAKQVGSSKAKEDSTGTSKSDSENASTGTTGGTSHTDSTTETDTTTANETKGASVSTTSNFPQNQLHANGNYAKGASESENIGSQTGSGQESVTGTVDGTTTGTSAENGTGSVETEAASTVLSDTDTETDTDTDTESSVSGYQAMPATLLNQFRSTIINIDMMVIADIEDCFMMVWGNSDELMPPKHGRF